MGVAVTVKVGVIVGEDVGLKVGVAVGLGVGVLVAVAVGVAVTPLTVTEAVREFSKARLSPDMEAVLGITVPPPAVTWATQVSVTLAPGATLPTFQVMGGALTPPPEAEVKASPAGTVSVITTPVAQSSERV